MDTPMENNNNNNNNNTTTACTDGRYNDDPLQRTGQRLQRQEQMMCHIDDDGCPTTNNNHASSTLTTPATTTTTTTTTNTELHHHHHNSFSKNSTGMMIQKITSLSDLLLHHRTIPTIFLMETSERFAYYGSRALLVRYLINELHCTEMTAIALYGYNTSISYLTPLVGAYCADSYYGRYRTILYFGGIYVFGLVLLTMATTISTLPYKQGLSFFGLFLICIGTGGIKPCVSSFGADQLSTTATHSINTPTTTTISSSTTLGEDVAPGCITITVPKESSRIHRHCTVPDDDDDNDEEESCRIETDLQQPQPTVVPNDDDDDNINKEAMRVYFNYFYFCINIGAIASIAIVPTIRSVTDSFTYAFLTSLVCMIFAMCLFHTKRNQYIQIEVVRGNNPTMISTIRLTSQLLSQQIKSQYPSWMQRRAIRIPTTIGRYYGGYHLTTTNHRRTHSHGSDNINDGLDGIRKLDETDIHNEDDDDDDRTTPVRNNCTSDPQQQELEDATQILHILPILAMFPIYSCLYDQQGSVWTIQATHMHVPTYMEPEQMNMINPLLIMMFIPLFDQMIYPFLQHTCHVSIAPLRLMSWGMALTALAFTCSGFVDSAIEYHTTQTPATERQVHVMWQIPQITLLAIGEIFISVTGLEFAYAQSPIRLKAFVTALYLSTAGIGDLLAGILYSTIFSDMKRGTVMHICSVMMLCNLRIFVWVARLYENRTSLLRHRNDASYSHVETSDPSGVELPNVGYK